jgi:hypothetical protein
MGSLIELTGISWPPPTMCYGNYFDLPMTNPVDETERKVRKEIPASTAHITGPPIRGFSHTFHTGVYLRREGLSGDGTPLSVLLDGSFNLGCGCRMKSNPCVRQQYVS